MERIWRLYGYRRQVRNFNQQDPPVFHLYIYSHHGLACDYLHGAGVLEEYEKIYLGGKKKPMVLSVKDKRKADLLICPKLYFLI
jgi:hypothetical protein